MGDERGDGRGGDKGHAGQREPATDAATRDAGEAAAVAAAGEPLWPAWQRALSALREGELARDAGLLLDDLEDLALRRLRGTEPVVGPELLERVREGADRLEARHRPEWIEDLAALCRELCGERAPSSRVHHLMALATVERAVRESAEDAIRMLATATDSLLAARVRLVLVGGVSGAGKSVLSRQLAPLLDSELLRSDELRKELAGVRKPLDETVDTQVIGPEGSLYAPDTVREIYDAMLGLAGAHLARGRSVVLDATWLDPRRRTDAETAAADHFVELVEIECTAGRGVLAERLQGRRRDAEDPSDATIEVLDEQLEGREPWPDAVVIDTEAVDPRDPEALRRWVRQESGLEPLPWA